MATVTTHDGAHVLSYINSTRNPVATILQTITVTEYKPAPSVAYFSSRGPIKKTANLIKMGHYKVLNKVPERLVVWRNRMKDHHINQLFKYVGHLPSLVHVTPNVAIIHALLKYWDPECSVFRFGEYELTPTLEEIAGLLQMPLKRHPMVFPTIGTKQSFFKFLGLKEISVDWNPNANSCEISLLYDRYMEEDSFNKFYSDFRIDKQQWEEKRIQVFALTLINILLFPQEHGKVSIRTVNMIQQIFEGVQGKIPTLVPVIIADIFTAATKCQGKARFFNASNLVLQMWAMEHLTIRTPKTLGPCLPVENWIRSHQSRVNKYYKISSPEEFIAIFQALTSETIQWVLDWTKWKDPAFRTTQHDFIPLPSMNDTVAYIPQRVMRQFGYAQQIPQVQGFKEFAGQNCVAKRSMILEAWGNLQNLKNVFANTANRDKPQSSPLYDQWIKSVVEEKKVAAEAAHPRQSSISPEQNRRLKEEMERLQIQLIEANNALADAKEKMKKDLRAEAKKERMLEAMGKIQDGIRRLRMGHPSESKQSRLYRYEEFVDFVDKSIQGAVNDE